MEKAREESEREMVKMGGSFVFVLSVASFFFLLVILGAEPVDPRPHELRYLSLETIQEKKQEGNGVGRGCSYTVKIKTSCSSSRFTRDMISLAFGDAYRNEVYAPRLDDPTTGTFERCSTDTFKIQGPCGYGICYLYLRRDGWDGWTPEWVKVYEPHASRATTFYYGTPLPNAVWYGFNHCPRPAAAAASLSLSS